MKVPTNAPWSSQELDSFFYQPADSFFRGNSGLSLTYDDVTLATLYSEILPKDANFETRLGPGLYLHLPIEIHHILLLVHHSQVAL